MEYGYFAMFYQFLLYNMNQLYAYMYPIPLQPASLHHPTPLKATVKYHLTSSEWPSSKSL